jgi:hypothetical protein
MTSKPFEVIRQKILKKGATDSAASFLSKRQFQGLPAISGSCRKAAAAISLYN